MGHTLLGVLGLLLLNTLLYGHAEAGRRTVTLTADRTVIPPGGRVTLTCAVEDPAGFKYQWFRQTSDSSGKTPLQTENVSESNRVISQGGTYTCYGWRSEPDVITPDSDAVIIEETVSNRATLTLQPNWPQIFSGETITLRCEIKYGGNTEWTYEWYKDNLKTTTTSNEYRIISATEAHSGEYRCKGRRDSYFSTEWSDAIKLTVSSNRPKAELRADDRDIPVGGSVTLTCSVDPSAGWKYFWYRGEKTSEHLTTQLSAGRRSVSHGGVYWCRGGRGEPVYYTEYSDPITISNNVHNKAVVTLQPNWSEIYRGETITLRCEIKDGGDTEWEYEWKTTSSEKPSNLNEHSIRFATASHRGDYWCKGRKKSEKSSTDWSDPFKLTVSHKPRPVLTVSPSWLSAGASVTLNCSVEDQSAGWRFYWYKTVPDPSNNYYSYELLPGNSSGTEQDSYIVQGQTHTAGYVCRAGRGDPVYYSDYSKPKFVWSADFHSSASLTVSPDRAQHFTSDSVSLSCEGNSTEWRVKRLSTEDRYPSDCTTWGTMTGSTCKLRIYRRSDAVYWCESGSGEFSNAVNITIQDGDMILLSPARPVTEGDSVSLSCKLRSQTFDSSVFFYHNEKLIQNDTRWELNISAVSKSDEGFYKCQYWRRESAQSWMSVQAVSRPESSSFPVLLIVGLVCGIVLILLLLLLCRYRPSKDTCFNRPIQSESSNTDQNEAQCNTYDSLLHADVCLYEVIKRSEDTENVAGGSQHVTYSSVELEEGKQHTPEETSIYSNVGTGAADKDVILASPASTMYQGESVTLRCRHQTQRKEKNASFYRDGSLILSNNTVEITIQLLSDGSSYMCKFDEDEESQPIRLKVEPNRPKANLKKDDRASVGANVTLTCSVNPSSPGWKYFWYRGKKASKPLTAQDVFFISNDKISVSQGALYWCRGGRGEPVYYTEYSDSIEPQPVLTVSPSWLSAGASVTLNCSVKDQSAGWRFYWYKAVSKLSNNYYSVELLPGSSSGTEQDSYIVHGQTHTARYVCRAGRGDPVYYSDYSAPKFVWSADSHPAASLTVSPDRVQHFFQDSVTLKCDGNSTSWRVVKFNEYGHVTQCSIWGKMTGSTCKTHTSQYINGVYWCESETGQFSNAVNITGQYGEIILVSPVHRVAEGHPVTLGCKLKTETVLSNVDFYKDGQLIQNGTGRELTIPAVSKSDEGLYKCKGQDSPHGWQSWTSPESWMSVKSVTRSESSLFPVLWIVGPVCGVLLIILLLLLLLVCRYHHCTKSKESYFIRSQSTNRGSATDHMINQDETQFRDVPSSLYGDAVLYESIKCLEEAEHEESNDGTYSSIELRNIGKNNGPEEGAVESAADDDVMYAKVHCRNKAMKDNRKSSPAAADETVYSEVKPGAPLGNNEEIK
ncbi:sialoadhesin-like [Pagrus major]|uniref:sialoadhesin-like n=1 Tax=Pagrus major TaxID=143350 RepID=UPI003CC852BE